MSSQRSKLYVESLANVAPNIFGPNVAAEKAATRRNRSPLQFNKHTYYQQFGWANAPANTGAIVPEGVERQPGHSWYGTLQANKKSKTIRFPFGDPRRSEEAIEEMVNPHYRPNAAASVAGAQAGTLANTPYGLRFSNLMEKTAKRRLDRAITHASQFGVGNLGAAIEARRQQGVTNLEAARAAAVALETQVREPSGNAGGAGSSRRRRRKTRRRNTRRRR
jgi:hypothetical protein